MGVLLHAHYRQPGPKGQHIVMPAPVDGATPNAPWWWDRLAAQAADLRRAGFSAVLLPPVCKTASGAAPDADGYGLFDNYDIGSRDQYFSVPTRFGDRPRLQRMIAIMHACGLDVYADVVMHQYYGGDNGRYEYLGADGKTRNGRFPKHPSCFVGVPPRVPVDPVANPEGNFSFGDMVAYVNSTPKGYMLEGAIDAADWLTRSLDLQGYRVDDVKGMNVGAVHHFLTSKSMATRFAVAEYFDGNPGALHWWVWQSGMGGRCQVFDLTLHWAIAGMCNNTSRWNMAQLQNAGYCSIDPFNAVTFVDNPDTDLSYGENVIWNKLLGYAVILTFPGYPSIYYKDYSPDPGCYGLKPWIDNLIWIHENLCFGPQVTRWADMQTYVHERTGHPGLLVGLNNDQWNYHQRTVETSFAPGVQLHDYTGRHPDIWTDHSGRATFTLPPNNNGQSYLCFSRTGYGQPFPLARRSTTQIFLGAVDLDIPPARPGGTTRVGQIWCEAHTQVEAQLDLDRAIAGPAGKAGFRIIDASGETIVSGQHAGSGNTRMNGWHAIEIRAEQLPSPSPFELTVTYTGTENLPS